MITITAIITARAGQEDALRNALQAVADHVAEHEPETIGFHISQSIENPQVFTTYERFEDEPAMQRHNHSEAVARFFQSAESIMEGSATLHICRELAGISRSKPVS